MNPTLRKYLIVTVTTLAVAVCLPLTTRKTEMGHPPVKLRCVIDLKGEPVRGLTVGMNKIILREFADDHGLDIEFITPADTSNYLDSLQDETVDLLVMFRADSLHRDGFISTLPYRDSTVWVVRDDRRDAVRRLNAWISAMEQGGGIRKIGRTYLRRVGSSLTSISPYDDLVKKNAREMGWDWRLLSAMIYHESKFINESCSARGAVGLMQIHNEQYSVDTLLDPAVNISIGTKYLTYLSDFFAEHGADSLERLKFALAAYNAGEGNILKCIRTAEELDVDPTRWDNIVGIMPEVPGFSGKQTIAYVREVLNTYEEYAEVYPR
ncbi:MAG: transglycosylase SLT domain-containing protein [Bacteroidales bacterium]|jgi:membrane-bound lytic murein transglycosylase F|nr:transglycosylase SLT domain-containing protein [Bacteroidales bacterium]